MKILFSNLLVAGILTVLVGIALVVVQCDQVIRSHEAIERLRNEVAEIKRIPPDQRTILQAQRLEWRQSDVEYFEDSVLPKDYLMLAGFMGILVVGMVVCIASVVIVRKQRLIASPP